MERGSKASAEFPGQEGAYLVPLRKPRWNGSGIRRDSAPVGEQLIQKIWSLPTEFRRGKRIPDCIRIVALSSQEKSAQDLDVGAESAVRRVDR